MADPGFPRGGGTKSGGGGGECQHTILPKFPENSMKSKEFGRQWGGGRGGRVPRAPPKSANGNNKIIRNNNNNNRNHFSLKIVILYSGIIDQTGVISYLYLLLMFNSSRASNHRSVTDPGFPREGTNANLLIGTIFRQKLYGNEKYQGV